jgi:Leucine-rich repeat (LRR) protein
LEELDVRQNNITDKDIRNFVGPHAMSRFPKLKKADLGSNQLGDEGAIALACSGIPYLGLMQNGITKVGFSKIMEQHTIQDVNLFNNDISFDEDDPRFPHNASLTRLDLGSNRLDDKAEAVLKAIASIPTLETLELAFNHIGDSGARILHQYRSKSVKEIGLFDNQIEDAELIVRGFKTPLK